MSTPTENLRMLLELYADGELDAAQRAEVERELETNREARDYLDTLHELHFAAQTPFDLQAESIDFDRISANVMAALDNEAPSAAKRDAELELLAMSRYDGERLRPADEERVAHYLDVTPAAREGLQALSELREVVRMPVERAAESVDFGLLAGRIMRAVEREDGPKHAPSAATAPSVWQQIANWFGSHRAMAAGFAGAVVALAIALPLTLSQRNQQPTINNYYVGTPSIDTVGYDPGHWGSYRPGDDMHAPVVWIEADPSSLQDVNGESPEGHDNGSEDENRTQPDSGSPLGI
jgi:hypothetical protein